MTVIEVSLEAHHVLDVGEVWPDGDMPDVPTARDVLALLNGESGYRLKRNLDEWNLLDGLEVRVRVSARNPECPQDESLLPDYRPPAWIVTAATVWT